MEDAEIKRRLIGLLTLVYQNGSDPDTGADIEALQSAFTSLMDGIEIIQPNHDVARLICDFMEIFSAMCDAIKTGHPDFDIRGFLEREAIDAAAHA
jgi:hypothetical protein